MRRLKKLRQWQVDGLLLRIMATATVQAITT
jgi:hypothetical protein